MSNPNAELLGRYRNPLSTLMCIAFATLLAGACTPDEVEPPPAEEMQVELKTGSAESHETRGAPYPPAEPSDRTPNVDDEEWPPVPDGPMVGDMQPANPQVGLKEGEIER